MFSTKIMKPKSSSLDRLIQLDIQNSLINSRYAIRNLFSLGGFRSGDAPSQTSQAGCHRW